MYCPECGKQIEDDALFCPECGTRVADAELDTAESAEDVAVPAGTPAVQALILTHMPALADRLRVSEDAVRAVIDAFIAVRRMQGVTYTLVDAAACEADFGVQSLPQDASWTRWADLVRDICCAAEEGRSPRAEYLFIIGGDDIVPMPVMPHYLAADGQTTDTTIDTDLPYAYPCGAQSALQGLATGEIYDGEVQYMVGRLPLPSDARLRYLSDYLQRAAAEPCVAVERAYAQSDPHWRKVTRMNVAALHSCGLLRNEDSGETCYSGIYLTPEVDAGSVAHYMSAATQLSFFNLHGSSAPAASGFMGQSVKDAEDWRIAIQPSDLQRLTQPNVVVTEACYGARFKGFDTAHSMVQSALAAQTLLYLGSSRIAYGALDSNFGDGRKVVGKQADVLTSEFVTALMQGYPAGDALCMARYAMMDKWETGPYEATTLAEFNLYGDPVLQVSFGGAGKSAPRVPVRPARPRRGVASSTGAKSIRAEKTDIGGGSLSLLQRLRAAVDRNISDIQDRIAKELYDYWGISPRRCTGASTLHYSSGNRALALHYEVDDEAALDKSAPQGLLTRICVITDGKENDRIQAVYTTR